MKKTVLNLILVLGIIFGITYTSITAFADTNNTNNYILTIPHATFQIVDADTKQPIANALVNVQANTNYSKLSYYDGYTDSEGKIYFDKKWMDDQPFKDGQIRVEVYKQPYQYDGIDTNGYPVELSKHIQQDGTYIFSFKKTQYVKNVTFKDGSNNPIKNADIKFVPEQAFMNGIKIQKENLVYPENIMNYWLNNYYNYEGKTDDNGNIILPVMTPNLMYSVIATVDGKQYNYSLNVLDSDYNTKTTFTVPINQPATTHAAATISNTTKTTPKLPQTGSAINDKALIFLGLIMTVSGVLVLKLRR